MTPALQSTVMQSFMTTVVIHDYSTPEYSDAVMYDYNDYSTPEYSDAVIYDTVVIATAVSDVVTHDYCTHLRLQRSRIQCK